jgi:DNA gyrase subunit A
MLPLVELIADPRTVQEEGGLIRLTDEQARAILALTLSRLTGLGRDEIGNEAATLAEAIKGYLDLLSDRANIMAVVREELVEVRDKFAIPRRCQIVDGDADMEDEDLIVREEMVITVTLGGYVKRTPLAAYRTQHRGGKGKAGMATKNEDAVTRVFSASTHAPLLFFTSGGKVYKMKVWRLPLGVANSRGKAFVNLLPIEPGETITSILALPEDEATWNSLDVMFATRSGSVRRNKLSDFVDVRRNGKIAMKLDEGDGIVGVAVCDSSKDILLNTASGRCIRFSADEVRVFASRDSTGVRGVRLAEGDSVISMSVLRNVDATPAERAAYLKHQRALARALGEEGDEAPAAPEEGEEEGGEASLTPERIAELGAAEEILLTVSSEGFGKRTSAYDYRRTGRGGQGLTAQDLSKRGGKLVGSFPNEEGDQILLVTDAGQMIRVPVSQIRVAARNTQGVTIFRTAADEHVVSVERLAETGGDDTSSDDTTGDENGADETS